MKLAIVEDEKVYVDKLREYLNKYQRESAVEVRSVWFSDGSEIAEDYSGDYDIILMDIQMKFMDGISAARKIREMDQEVIIIFITNMTNYAIRGYEVDAMDYIVKPVEYFAFSHKLDRAVKRIRKKEKHYISIPMENGVRKMDIAGIYYIESHGHMLQYKTDEGAWECRGTLQQMESLLMPYGFFRNSKSYLVNIQHVDAIRENECMVQGERLPVGRAKKKEFMQKMLCYMSGEM